MLPPQSESVPWLDERLSQSAMHLAGFKQHKDSWDGLVLLTWLTKYYKRGATM